jgi:alpha-glucosidase
MLRTSRTHSSKDAPRAWWRQATIYEIYVRSFADSNGDGIGDLAGITQRLDYLRWLGVDVLWLTPIHPSPNADFGYDVADYYGVHPDYGTLQDFDELLNQARHHGLRIILDLVAGHTSSHHPWFEASRSDPNNPFRHWYVWQPGAPDEPPNNWLNTLGAPAWTYDEATASWYLHNYFSTQPDLNWHNGAVRAEFEKILHFWFDRGVSGFRIDVAHGIVKDRHLRNNPPATIYDVARDRRFGQRQVWNVEQPGIHDVYRTWRRIAASYPEEKLLLGETYILDPVRVATFYGDDDELHLAQNVMLTLAPFNLEDLAAIVDAAEATLPPHAMASWFISNHDISRAPTRWAMGDSRKLQLALLILLGLRGVPALYYGDELGLEDAAVAAEDLVDPVSVVAPAGRDAARAAMPWEASTTSSPWWLRFTAPHTAPVTTQKADASSVLRFCHHLLGIRARSDDLKSGAYQRLPSPTNVWFWVRGQETYGLANGDTRTHQLECARLDVLAENGTRRTRSGLAFPPLSGALFRTSQIPRLLEEGSRCS